MPFVRRHLLPSKRSSDTACALLAAATKRDSTNNELGVSTLHSLLHASAPYWRKAPAGIHICVGEGHLENQRFRYRSRALAMVRWRHTFRGGVKFPPAVIAQGRLFECISPRAPAKIGVSRFGEIRSRRLQSGWRRETPHRWRASAPCRLFSGHALILSLTERICHESELR